MKGKSNQFFSQFKDKFIFSFLLKRYFLHSIALRSIKTIPFVPKVITKPKLSSRVLHTFLPWAVY